MEEKLKSLLEICPKRWSYLFNAARMERTLGDAA